MFVLLLLKLSDLLKAAILKTPYFPMARTSGADLLPFVWTEAYSIYFLAFFLALKVITCNHFLLAIPIKNDSFGILPGLICYEECQVFVVSTERERDNLFLVRVILFIRTEWYCGSHGSTDNTTS